MYLVPCGFSNQLVSWVMEIPWNPKSRGTIFNHHIQGLTKDGYPGSSFVTFLGWLSDPCDLQLGYKKVTLNHLDIIIKLLTMYIDYNHNHFLHHIHPLAHRIHVWYISLHLPYKSTKCREIYQPHGSVMGTLPETNPWKWWFPIVISFSRGLFLGANC